MLPWKTIIEFDRTLDDAVYLQISKSIIREIKNGIIQSSVKMPGTRALSVQLQVNRQTIVKAYDELYAQGWLIALPAKGTFVNTELPEVKPRKLVDRVDGLARETGFDFEINTTIHTPSAPNRHIMGFHDGPDVRLIPVEQLASGYRRILKRRSNLNILSYVEVEGRQVVREAISEYLNSSRGLQTKYQNIMVTRGTSMALYILSEILISPGDLLITAGIGYRYADLTFLNAGAKLIKLEIDEHGIDVDEIERICQRKTIRAVYVTSHHHYPTTVTLCAARRMKLLQLAETYGFIIIEDDYDYEFHYESSPILPLASADVHGMVVYIGSFSKTLGPAIRVGYIAAPPNLINEVAKFRQLIDVQGDPVLEQVVAEMIREGEIIRHMKKALKEYTSRRQNMCEYLNSNLKDFIEFKAPEGGLAIWAEYDPKIDLVALAAELKKHEVIISNGLINDASAGRKLNSTRMGFGWMNVIEANHALDMLEKTIRR